MIKKICTVFLVIAVISLGVVYLINDGVKSEGVVIDKNIITEEYKEDRINIYYPQIENVDKSINDLIKKETLNGLKYYEEKENLTLDINYDIKLLSDDYISIVYSGIGYIQGTAHPNNIFYTTNINLKDVKKTRLTDIVTIDEDFLDLLRKSAKEQLPDAIYESFSTTSFGDNEKLLKYLKNSDKLELNSEEQFDTFSYMTDDKIGISLPVSHAIGDYIEIEISK